ncbi:MAG: hypothetical protein M3548_08270 [Actinomycetota bacterium]|nr:hypothetical protein [Actinomycetota bacterium]
MTAAEIDADESGLSWPEPVRGANQPWRAGVAAVEVVIAGLLFWLASWLWSEGTVFVAEVAGRPDLSFEQYQGSWLAAALAVATLAAILLLDALRQLALAVRTRSR